MNKHERLTIGRCEVVHGEYGFYVVDENGQYLNKSGVPKWAATWFATQEEAVAVAKAPALKWQ